MNKKIDISKLKEQPGVQGLVQLAHNAIDRINELERENAQLRDLLANQKFLVGSPINPLTDADIIRNACPRTYNRCGYDAIAKKCLAEGCPGHQSITRYKSAVFCANCLMEWTVPYIHSGKSICSECEAKLNVKTVGRNNE